MMPMNPTSSWFAIRVLLLPALLVGGVHAVSGVPLALHVSGTTLVDSSGAVVVLHGVNIPSLETQNTGEGPPPGGSEGLLASVDEVIQNWHVNLVRLPICQDRWEGKAPVDHFGIANNADAYRAIVDRVVAKAAAAGVYVLVDMHWSDAGVWGKNLGQHKMPDDNTATA